MGIVNNKTIIMSQVTNIEIYKVKGYKYNGRYKKIFQILESDLWFCERYETDESIGLIGDTYFLQVEGGLDTLEYEKITKLKNVKIID